jgi:hypothetical protein
MSLDLRDELAAVVAATMVDRQGSSPRAERPDVVARRAYDLADALLRERAGRERATFGSEPEWGLVESTEPRLETPPHHPSWEVEPRWSDRDRARLQARLAEHRHDGPGLASTRPDADGDERTGT